MKPDHKAPSRGGEHCDERGEELTQRILIAIHKATARGDEGSAQAKKRISKPAHKAPSRGGERGDERGEELTQRISITAHKATARGDEGGDQPRQ